MLIIHFELTKWVLNCKIYSLNKTKTLLHQQVIYVHQQDSN